MNSIINQWYLEIAALLDATQRRPNDPEFWVTLADTTQNPKIAYAARRQAASLDPRSHICAE